MRNLKKAYVYIDGFNLFYATLKGGKYKWLDLNKLLSSYYPNYRIEKIKYFTAKVISRKNDLNISNRQATYLRALKTLDNLEIILGAFLENEIKVCVPERTRNKFRQRANVELNKAKMVLPLLGRNYFFIKKTEEKGSDVNIASHLIIDAYEEKFDVAVVVSNDSDLADAIKTLIDKKGVAIKILSPYKKISRKLLETVSSKNIKKIRISAVKNSQFKDTLIDNNGPFYKPKNWQ